MKMIPWRRPHPAYVILSRHADGELSARETMELNSHLAACEECREEVDFMVTLRARLREAPLPGPPRALLADILTRRESGERGWSPVDDCPLESRDPSIPVRSAATIAAALAFAAISLVFFSPGEIGAGSSALELDAGTPGSTIGVEFTTTAPGADVPALTLRGEYFTASDPTVGITHGAPFVAGLRREAPGRFVGDLTLPADVIYARFVVEDAYGEVLASDPRQGWEYFARNRDDEPTFDALWRRVMLLQEQAPDLARASLDRLLKLYPDRPEAWAFQWFFDQGAGDAEATRPEHRARLARFVRGLPAEPRPDALGYLADYALALGDEETEARLLNRLSHMAPAHPALARKRLARLAAEWGGNPQRFAAALEAEWASYGAPHENLLEAGLVVSLGLGDAAGARRWATRWRTAGLGDAPAVARAVAGSPELSDDALAWLREDLRTLDDAPPASPLARSRAEHRRAIGRDRAELLATLGRLLVERGDTGAGADTLALAAEILWRPDLFREVADLFALLGREGEAVRYHALAAGDPLDGATYLGHADHELAAFGLDADARRTTYERAAADYRAWLLGGPGDPVYARGPMVVTTREGATVDLAAELAGTITIVKFWSPGWSVSTDDLRAMLEDCRRLAGGGARLVVVAVDAVLDGSIVDHSACPDTPLLVDSGWAARARLLVTDLSATLVVDEHGRVRARVGSPDAAKRIALALAALD